MAATRRVLSDEDAANRRPGADRNYFIDCNSQLILINTEAPEGPRLTGEWGGDQCAGCGIDIVETGRISTMMTEVTCINCGARYPVQQEEGR